MCIVIYYILALKMPKTSKKALGLAVEFSSVKEDILKMISKLSAKCTRKFSRLSTTQLAQIFSVMLHNKQHTNSLLFIENNLEFVAEYLSQDTIRELNNRNIRRNRINRCFPVSEEIYKMIKINSYFQGNKALRVSLSLASQNRIMADINMLTVDPQVYNKSFAH